MKGAISERTSIAFLCFTGYDLSFVIFCESLILTAKLLLFCLILKYNHGQMARKITLYLIQALNQGWRDAFIRREFLFEGVRLSEAGKGLLLEQSVKWKLYGKVW